MPKKQKSADEWQHALSPKPIKTTLLYNDPTSTKPQPPTPDTNSEDLYELYKDTPDIYHLRQTFEPETEQETQNQHPTTSLPQGT